MFLNVKIKMVNRSLTWMAVLSVMNKLVRISCSFTIPWIQETQARYNISVQNLDQSSFFPTFSLITLFIDKKGFYLDSYYCSCLG